MNKKDMGYFILMGAIMLIGALIGYGSYGDIQHACLGAGLSIPVLLLILFILFF